MKSSAVARGFAVPVLAVVLASPLLHCGGMKMPGGMPGGLPGAGKCPDLKDPEAILEVRLRERVQDQGRRRHAKLKAGTAAAVELEEFDGEDRRGAEDGLRQHRERPDGRQGRLQGRPLGVRSRHQGDRRREGEARRGREVLAHRAAPALHRRSVGHGRLRRQAATSNVKPGSKPRSNAKAAKISGTCDASCSGSCDVEAGAKCDGECHGTCDAEHQGQVRGQVRRQVRRQGVSKGATCAGTCDGKCDAQVEATCSGKCGGECKLKAEAKCEGTCSGKCSAEMKAPKCEGEVKPPEMSAECKGELQRQRHRQGRLQARQGRRCDQRWRRRRRRHRWQAQVHPREEPARGPQGRGRHEGRRPQDGRQRQGRSSLAFRAASSSIASAGGGAQGGHERPVSITACVGGVPSSGAARVRLPT